MIDTDPATRAATQQALDDLCGELHSILAGAHLRVALRRALGQTSARIDPAFARSVLQVLRVAGEHRTAMRMTAQDERDGFGIGLLNR